MRKVSVVALLSVVMAGVGQGLEVQQWSEDFSSISAWTASPALPAAWPILATENGITYNVHPWKDSTTPNENCVKDALLIYGKPIDHAGNVLYRPAGQTLTDGDAFRVNIGTLSQSATNGVYSMYYIGLANSSGLDMVSIFTRPASSSANYVLKFFLHVVTSDGSVYTTYGTTSYISIDRDIVNGTFSYRYSADMTYDPTARTLSLTLNNQTCSLPIPAGKAFSVDRFQFKIDAGSSTTYAQLLVDNVSLWKTVPDPVPVEGTVVPQGYAGDNTSLYLRFFFRSLDLQDNVTRNVVPNDDGTFRLENIPPGSYAVSVESAFCLKKDLGRVEVAANPTPLGPIELKPADSNGDNRISFEDFSLLQNNYGQSGAASANPLAAAAASGGCGGLGMALLLIAGLAGHGLGWRRND